MADLCVESSTLLGQSTSFSRPGYRLSSYKSLQSAEGYGCLLPHKIYPYQVASEGCLNLDSSPPFVAAIGRRSFCPKALQSHHRRLSRRHSGVGSGRSGYRHRYGVLALLLAVVVEGAQPRCCNRTVTHACGLPGSGKTPPLSISGVVATGAGIVLLTLGVLLPSQKTPQPPSSPPHRRGAPTEKVRERSESKTTR
ncbi:unnamed protein product [Musa textilis]